MDDVAPFTGAWIEILRLQISKQTYQSLPSRERGLKSLDASLEYSAISVAPFTGAWIEINFLEQHCQCVCVAPFTGAWIEIGAGCHLRSVVPSLPSRERGLKFLP